ncbi:acyl-CoA dehydrogenase family protein [Dactylosporangium sp. CS-033363]|uniref:acyl-CoA dehydrogenase family protein n=1 Tax=Dactylosporangium sp. CS-033363 TaxID=3239935 RepID=UPI003D8DA7A0
MVSAAVPTQEAPTAIPSREELVRRATGLADTLRAHTDWSEENRRVHDETIAAAAEAGLFRLRTPKRYGGFEADTRTIFDVATELGRADGAASWVTSVYWIPTWMTCLLPDPAQDEVFATPDVRICGTLSPSAMAEPAEGGIVVNGKWSFVSGALHAQWQQIVAVLVHPEHGPVPIIGVVPIDDLKIVDDWHTSGLRGTGSVTTIAENVFVPGHRFVLLPAILQGQHAGTANAESPIYRAPLLPVASASSAGTALGLAKGALDAFLARLPERKITYTSYERQAEAPLTHHQVATATMKIDQAEFHGHRLTSLVDTKCAGGTAWTVLERAQARADLGAVCRLAKEAVDILQTASGGSSIYHDVAIQRIHRDIAAVNLHALMHPDTNDELYGRVLCGLEPNTLYI